MPTKIDAKKLIASFGGRTLCHELLVKSGHTVSKKALEKWQERQSIPLNRLLQLADADLKFHGRVLNIQEFVVHE
jgi:hypothetical protein